MDAADPTQPDAARRQPAAGRQNRNTNTKLKNAFFVGVGVGVGKSLTMYLERFSNHPIETKEIGFEKSSRLLFLLSVFPPFLKN